METDTNTNTLHIGRKIERIRRLRRMTQTELGNMLGVTKQAVSKMEQSEKIESERLKQIAEALGVTEEGLRKFTEEIVLYCTNNFSGNSNATATDIGGVSHAGNINQFSVKQAVKLFEELLKIEREKFESLKREKQ